MRLIVGYNFKLRLNKKLVRIMFKGVEAHVMILFIKAEIIVIERMEVEFLLSILSYKHGFLIRKLDTLEVQRMILIVVKPIICDII